jgi:hypothetical protein
VSILSLIIAFACVKENSVKYAGVPYVYQGNDTSGFINTNLNLNANTKSVEANKGA